ncbi:MAG: RNA 2'-phosphotransferase [Deltaproteobacteria bacterium]|jgi:putative RNA 2'-phosphotransferase|nr:RNA 2'-phosphotransferase [Deltaproteobacteria bacterium]
MSRKTTQAKNSLDKLLRYALGIQPDEFGLVLNKDGYVSLKELLGALRDEDGFRGLNESRIREVFNQSPDRAFELEGNLVRLKDGLREPLPRREEDAPLPGELFAAMREGAWRAALEKGLSPRAPAEDKVRLFRDKEAALRAGRRFIKDPVLVRTLAKKAAAAGTEFFPYGEHLWLSPFVPSAFLSGPALKKEEPEAPQKTPAPAADPFGAGEIRLFGPLPSKGKKKGKYSDSPDWKNRARKDRRDSEKKRDGS